MQEPYTLFTLSTTPKMARPTLYQINDFITDAFEEDRNVLLEGGRTLKFSTMRCLFCALARAAGYKLEEIGAVANLKHSSVLHHLRYGLDTRFQNYPEHQEQILKAIDEFNKSMVDSWPFMYRLKNRGIRIQNVNEKVEGYTWGELANLVDSLY